MSKTKENKPERKETDLTSLTVKVPDQLRRYWLAQAKMRGTTLSAIIVEHLTKTLGKPE